jgi:hypothetical protein
MKILALTFALVFIIGMGVPYGEPNDPNVDNPINEPSAENDQPLDTPDMDGDIGGFAPDYNFDGNTCDYCAEDDCTVCNPPDYCHECGECGDCEVQYYCDECKDETCPLCCVNDDCIDGCWICAGLVCDDGDCGYCNDCTPLPVFDDDGDRPTIVPTSTPGDPVPFVDPNFEAAVRNQLNIPVGQIITVGDVESVTELHLYSSGISNLSGIEYFVALTDLYAGDNQLTGLNLSNNTVLKWLDIWNNQLTALNVSSNTALVHLNADSNRLTTLDVSNNPALENLYIVDNHLAALNVNNNTALTELIVSNNQLSTLNVNNNLVLSILSVGDNQLTSLDVSNNVVLTSLHVCDNRLTTLNVSSNLELYWLMASNNQLTSLDMSNNTALTGLYVGGNQLTRLDVSKNSQLEWLNANNNQLTSVILNAVAPYWFIDLSFNNMTSESAVTGRNITWDGINFIFAPRLIADSVADGIEEALNSGEPLVLAPGANTNITAADLQEIKDSGGVLNIVLPNGLHISISAEDITDNARPIDLNIAVTLVTTATTVAGTQMQAPANSLIITPSTHGQFGFTININISAERLAAAGLSENINLYYVSSAGSVTNYGAVTLNSNGSATISISHASFYILSTTPPVTTPPREGGAPQTGDYRTLLLPGIMIAAGLLGLGGWACFNKRTKFSRRARH